MCDQDQHVHDLVEIGIPSRQVPKRKHLGGGDMDIRDHLEPPPLLRAIVRVTSGN